MKRVFMTSDAVGGVWNYTRDLVQALGAYEIEVVVAVMGPAPSAVQRQEMGELENADLFHAPYALEWMDRPWREVDAASQWLLNLAEDFQPDVIHLNGYVHGALSWSSPVLVTAHSCVSTWWRSVRRARPDSRYSEYRERVRRGLQSADAVVTPTHAFRSALEREYKLRLPGSTIYNARASSLLKPAAKEPFIFSAGRLWDDAKNIAMLTRVAPELAWPVHIAGALEEGSLEGEGVHFLGALSSPAMAGHLSRASIYAAPARYEPFGLSILEAALSGCALVLSDIPSLRELWEGCAIFIAPDDKFAWVSALQALINDDARRTLLQEQALRRAGDFDVARQAAAYHHVYLGLHQLMSPSLLPICA